MDRLERIRLICEESSDLCGPIMDDYRFLLTKIEGLVTEAKDLQERLKEEQETRKQADERLDKLLDWLVGDRKQTSSEKEV